MSLQRPSRRKWLGWVGLGAVLLLASGVSVLLLSTRNPKPKPLGHKVIKVEVLNGCGVSGIARRFSEFLQRQHFDVVYTGNASAFCFTESIVLDRTGNIDKAERVAQVLGIRNVIQYINTDAYRREEVTVIIGKDYGLLEPEIDRMP
jgi:hypothetical protein